MKSKINMENETKKEHNATALALLLQLCHLL